MTTVKDVLKMIKDNDVKYVDFRFTDPRGKWQHVTFDVTMIEEDTFSEGQMFDGSSIAGWKAGRAGNCASSGLNGVEAGLPRSDPDSFFNIGDENFAVADPPGLGGPADRLDGFFDHVVAEHNLDLHLGEKIHDVFGSAVKLGMSFLPAEALGFGHSDALQPDPLQRLFHLVELERLYDGFDFLHLLRDSDGALR